MESLSELGIQFLVYLPLPPPVLPRKGLQPMLTWNSGWSTCLSLPNLRLWAQVIRPDPTLALSNIVPELKLRIWIIFSYSSRGKRNGTGCGDGSVGEDVCCLVGVRTETLDSKTPQKSWASVVATFNFRTGSGCSGQSD